MGKSFRLNIPAEMDSLGETTTKIEEFCASSDVPTAATFKVNLMVQELLANSVIHGDFGDRDPEIILSLNCTDGHVELVYEDNAAPFDPFTETPPPDLSSELSDRPIGGLGVHLIRSFSDESSHEHVNGRNRIRLLSPIK